ncbi:MAG: serine hydrolase [Gemmatimonadetes bacterium]|nr:serine hydrolase [Gemmatimonadota bacterium]
MGTFVSTTTARLRSRILVLLTPLAALTLACGQGGGERAESGPLERAPAGGLAGVAEAVAFADSAVSDWIGRAVIPGAVLRVSTAEGVVLERAYGWAQTFEYRGGQYERWLGAPSGAGTREASGLRRLDEPRAMTTGTRFDLASVTKVMATTFALMTLVEEGRVDLDRPVSTWWPEVTGGGKEAITPRHLLTHTSGLAQWRPVYYGAEGPDQAYASVLEFPLSWPVGEERHYSDLGFMLLGGLVEAVSGMSLDQFLQERLYGPLGLTRTGFGPSSDGPFAATSHGNPFEYRMVHDSTFGYHIMGDADAWTGWRHRTLVGEVNDGNAHHAFGGVAGHAGLFSTAEELDVLLRLLLDGGVHEGTTLIGRSVIQAFLTPALPGQALGWQVPPGAPAGSFAHTGFTGTWVAAVPALDLSIVLLTNRQNGGVDEEARYPDVEPLRHLILDRFLAN